MKKRNIILLSSIALAVLLIAGGTLAWFTSEADPITNLFTAGTVEIELIDEFEAEEATNVNPGDTYDKVVRVDNEGTKAIFVRVKLTPEFEDGLSVDVVDFPILNGWILHTDGWYYYPAVIEAGDSTPNIIEEVIFAGAGMGNDYQGKAFTLEVEAEGIQASNGAALDLWGIDPLTLAGGI